MATVNTSAHFAARLVVNADGFGLTAARSQGVLAAHKRGIVTSTSVLGNAVDPEQIKRDLAIAPDLGVGVLLTLVGGFPVAKPQTVPSLVEAGGEFPARARDVLLAWAKAALRPDDIEREFDAQVARLRDLGLAIDHLNTRDHLGFLPIVAHAVENVARKHGIPGLRMAVEKPTLAWAAELPRGLATGALGGLAWFTRRQLGPRRHGPQTWGYLESGRLDEVRILEIIGRLGPGCHEIICQPEIDGQPKPVSQGAPPRSEVPALTSPRVREAIARRNIELCRWRDLF
jgi:predicted glycoside hydrolase/deacetylase ChbG (UPF0249 family)